MLFANLGSVLSSLLNMVLYMPRCRPEGDLLVFSFHFLKSPWKCCLVTFVGISGWRCWHSCSSIWRSLSLVVTTVWLVPFNISSARLESVAQFRSWGLPVVNGVPAHWLKCRWFLVSMASSSCFWLWTLVLLPLLSTCWTKVTQICLGDIPIDIVKDFLWRCFGCCCVFCICDASFYVKGFPVVG